MPKVPQQHANRQAIMLVLLLLLLSPARCCRCCCSSLPNGLTMPGMRSRERNRQTRGTHINSLLLLLPLLTLQLIAYWTDYARYEEQGAERTELALSALINTGTCACYGAWQLQHLQSE